MAKRCLVSKDPQVIEDHLRGVLDILIEENGLFFTQKTRLERGVGQVLLFLASFHPDYLMGSQIMCGSNALEWLETIRVIMKATIHDLESSRREIRELENQVEELEALLDGYTS